eukprot:gnl/TRDRNA2_/TRDRNA2_152025_c5_seq1.p1 gnl/TRDRNA2_/TRDRNA2_152025_c5~~gnl/TRDRNA2_/TRDRNA2_152025_c5_seq1.p1  ORF type:complete len:472 (-),score=73.23 gnl/TRDRNA2_/TRDRNA2_152025_c5_seq1:29-1402(-)
MRRAGPAARPWTAAVAAWPSRTTNEANTWQSPLSDQQLRDSFVEQAADDPSVKQPTKAAHNKTPAPPLVTPQNLWHDGIAVLPVFSSAEVAKLKVALRAASLDFPEFLPGARRLVLGGFGALGNPSSFHHPLVRHCRIRCLRKAIRLFRRHIRSRQLGKRRRLELLWDRLCWRRRGDRINYETPHRDISEHALPSDEVFGGWVNFDSTPQYFHCVPRSHHEVSATSKKGFCPEADSTAAKRMRRVEIPTGHLVIFYQRILHEVPKQAIAQESLRLFVGWRLTDGEMSLQDLAAKRLGQGVPDTEAVIRSQAAPLLPSGQRAPMYAKYHLIAWMPKLQQWSDMSFRANCKEWIMRNGCRIHIVSRYLTSLESLGLPRFAPYTQDEKSIMRPADKWSLEGEHLLLHGEESEEESSDAGMLQGVSLEDQGLPQDVDTEEVPGDVETDEDPIVRPYHGPNR